MSHILRSLSLPARFESLAQRVGPEVAKLLVEPGDATRRVFETIANSVRAQGEGLLVPIFASSGEGKTTFANSLAHFFPTSFAPTVQYTGEISYDHLADRVAEEIGGLKANDERIVPVNLDHRESSPPSDAELAALKRFLRAPSPGARCVLVWPETSREIAEEIAARFDKISGAAPVDLPVQFRGPAKSTWPDIAQATMEIANDVDSLIELGIDPHDYDPEEDRTIGEFLRRIAIDFATLVTEEAAQSRRPIRLTIVFVSTSPDAGVLSQLTSHKRFGLLDGKALVSATSSSVIGRWWTERPGLLTQTILRLDARAFGLPPRASVSILRQYGGEETTSDLDDLGIGSPGPAAVRRDIGRTDLGRYLAGEDRSTFESRGTPPVTSTPAFEALAEKGFTTGRDKTLNAAVLPALVDFLDDRGVSPAAYGSEEGLGFAPLIPDNSIDLGSEVLCLEYTWRSGDFLATGSRSEVAQYCLSKLQNYARELGWVAV